MSPPAFESGFDSLTQFGLEQIGMNPQFIADFENFEVMQHSFDFTSVDRTAARNVVNAAGKHASKRAFEEVGKVVDRSLEVVAATLGATGQWYGTAAAILGEEALDWAEAKFESYMGWEQEPIPAGHWVLIDEGTRRRRMPSQLDAYDEGFRQAEELHGRNVEIPPKSTLHRLQTLGYTMEAPHDGHQHLLRQDGREAYPRVSQLVELTPEMEKDLSNNESMQRIIEVAHHHKHGLERPIGDQIKARIGENVTIDGKLHVVQPGTNFQKLVAEADGHRVERRWDDPSVETSWNTGHLGTTFRSSAQHINRAFVTAAGFAVGQMVWFQGEMFVVVAVRGKDRVNMWSLDSGRSQEAAVEELEHVKGTDSLPQVVSQFRVAAVEGDKQKAMEFLPSKQFQGFTRQGPDFPRIQDVPQQRRGKRPEEAPFKPLREDFQYDTPGLAKRFDKVQEDYEKAAEAFRGQKPVFLTPPCLKPVCPFARRTSGSTVAVKVVFRA